MHMLRTLVLFSCVLSMDTIRPKEISFSFQFQRSWTVSMPQLPLPKILNDIDSDIAEISYPARYNFVSFWLAQLHRPLIACCVRDKETGDKVKVASWTMHRIADLVVPVYLAGKSFDNTGILVCRSGNVVAEELSLYGLKQYIGPGEYTFADGNIKVRKVAAARIWHKGLFKTIDKAIETKGNVVQSVKSGIRASAAEAVYIGVTQVVHALAPSQMHDYVQMILPENAYIHSNVQNLVKMTITSVASAMLAACVI